jgi:hypothetical protein
MKETNKVFRFKAPLQRKNQAGAWYYVTVPFDVAKEFGTKGVVRILGSYNQLPFDRALIPFGDGTHHIILSTEMRRKAGIKLGHEVAIEFTRNENPDEVTIPEELEEGFEIEPKAKEVFERQSTSFKRNVVIWINQAKQPETKAKRIAEALRRLTSPNQMFGGSRLR